MNRDELLGTLTFAPFGSVSAAVDRLLDSDMEQTVKAIARVCGTCKGSGNRQYKSKSEYRRLAMLDPQMKCPDCVEGIQPQGKWGLERWCQCHSSKEYGSTGGCTALTATEHGDSLCQFGWVAVVPVNLGGSDE